MAAPPVPTPGDLFGWELPHLESIDTIPFPRRLKRNRSFGRVVAELKLRYDGSQEGIEFAYVQNRDLLRWAEKILASATFAPARLDGSPQTCRLPAHVLFLPKDDSGPERYEVWLPTDTANYTTALRHHFLAANQCVPPLLLRASSFDRPAGDSVGNGTVVFEVYVNKDGSREEGRVVASPGDAYTREALAAMVDMRILPPRFRNASYGCWTRIVLGFYDDWDYPTRGVDLATEPYLGWPAPVITSVGAQIEHPPLFQSVDTTDQSFDFDMIRLAGNIVYGQATFTLLVDTAGQVQDWLRSRPVDLDALAMDAEYSEYKFPGSVFGDTTSNTDDFYTMPDLAAVAAADMENVIPYLKFLPGRDRDGHLHNIWITITPAILR